MIVDERLKEHSQHHHEIVESHCHGFFRACNVIPYEGFDSRMRDGEPAFTLDPDDRICYKTLEDNVIDNCLIFLSKFC